jgi:hypothetical protein
MTFRGLRLVDSLYFVQEDVASWELDAGKGHGQRSSASMWSYLAPPLIVVLMFLLLVVLRTMAVL